MEVAPFFIDFHDLRTFVAIYILSRFTHFFRNFFLAKIAFSATSHVFCMYGLRGERKLKIVTNFQHQIPILLQVLYNQSSCPTVAAWKVGLLLKLWRERGRGALLFLFKSRRTHNLKVSDMKNPPKYHNK